MGRFVDKLDTASHKGQASILQALPKGRKDVNNISALLHGGCFCTDTINSGTAFGSAGFGFEFLEIEVALITEGDGFGEVFNGAGSRPAGMPAPLSSIVSPDSLASTGKG